MKLWRYLLAPVPLLLSPLVMWLLDQSGDKAPALIIPWVAFALTYFIAFLVLARFIKGTLVLTAASMAVAIVIGTGLTVLVVSFLQATQGA